MHHRAIRALVAAVYAIATTAALAAQSARSADDVAIRAQLAAYADARDRDDSSAEAAFYTEDGDVRLANGAMSKGRIDVARGLRRTGTAKFTLEVESVRFVTSDVAVVDATARPTGNHATYVMRKQGRNWLIAAARLSLKAP